MHASQYLVMATDLFYLRVLGNLIRVRTEVIRKMDKEGCMLKQEPFHRRGRISKGVSNPLLKRDPLELEMAFCIDLQGDLSWIRLLVSLRREPAPRNRGRTARFEPPQDLFDLLHVREVRNKRSLLGFEESDQEVINRAGVATLEDCPREVLIMEKPESDDASDFLDVECPQNGGCFILPPPVRHVETGPF